MGIRAAYVVIFPAPVVIGFTSTGGAKPKVLVEKLVGINCPAVVDASVEEAIGPSAPFVVALFFNVAREEFPADVIAFPDKSREICAPLDGVPEISMDTYNS